MRIFNWFSNIKKGQAPFSEKITARRVLKFTKRYEELKPFFTLFTHYFKHILESEKGIEQKVKKIQEKTQQSLNEDQLLRGLRVLRYSCMYVWLFDLKPPKTITELSDELLVIDITLKSILKENNQLEYLSELNKGLSEFTDGELNLNNLGNFRKNFSAKLAEKIPQIVFECTEGRMGGELHDFLIELIMTTIQTDQKIFNMSNENTLTEEESQNIKKTITRMNEDRQMDADDFMESLGESI